LWDAAQRPWGAAQRLTAHASILSNAGSLVGATLVTSGLGYLFWGLAARRFPPAEVGLAAAAISAMILLGTVGMLGFGTLLIGELPRHAGREGPLIAGALAVAGAAGALLGALFAAAAPALSPDLASLAAGPGALALFALGVGLTAATLVLDQALIGLLRGGLQLGRNTLFAAAKLGLLLAVSVWVADRHGLTIYAVWLAGNVASLGVLGAVAAWQWGAWRRPRFRRPETLEAHQESIRWQGGASRRPRFRPGVPAALGALGTLRKLGRAAVLHHALNLSLQLPHLALPVVVTALLSATMNAYFYVAWMVTGFVFVVPVALTAAVYAVGARQPGALAQKLRFTLRLGLALGVLANAVLLVGAGLVLRLFGQTYADEAEWCLRILGWAVFPLLVKDHYVAVCRVHGRIGRAAVVVAAGALLELVVASVGARSGGLSGLALGWLAALCLEAAAMVPSVYRAAAVHAPPPSIAPATEPAPTDLSRKSV
jgi:O-antigen/teichoic acid export membrane protein